jgi:uncharacterized oxidoreductase
VSLEQNNIDVTKSKILNNTVMELKGKTVLVTGGTAGIGLEATKQFLANGAKVIITGRNQSKLDAVKKSYPTITAIQSDVGDADDAKSLFDQVKALGGIDILYNNAGVMSGPLNLGVANEKHFELAKYEMDINYLIVTGNFCYSSVIVTSG